jgi:hypothetical protein
MKRDHRNYRNRSQAVDIRPIPVGAFGQWSLPGAVRRRVGSSNAAMPTLKFAIRILFTTPFVSAITIVSLALGVGATAGTFSVFHRVLTIVAHGSESVGTRELERARPETRLREFDAARASLGTQYHATINDGAGEREHDILGL